MNSIQKMASIFFLGFTCVGYLGAMNPVVQQAQQAQQQQALYQNSQVCRALSGSVGVVMSTFMLVAAEIVLKDLVPFIKAAKYQSSAELLSAISPFVNALICVLILMGVGGVSVASYVTWTSVSQEKRDRIKNFIIRHWGKILALGVVPAIGICLAYALNTRA